MPRGDKTGPEGRGPLTGKRMGNCVGNETTGFFNRAGSIIGFGRGYRGNNGRFGDRFNRRRMSFFQNLPEQDERSVMENEINALKNQVSFLEKKLSELKDN